jgi:hypothetical protein
MAATRVSHSIRVPRLRRRETGLLADCDLVAVFAAAGSATLTGPALLAHRIGSSLTAGAALLVLALAIALIVRPRRSAEAAHHAPRSWRRRRESPRASPGLRSDG